MVSDLDAHLQSLLRQTVGDVATASGRVARAAVRRRVALLHRRRRLRHALGSSTLAAGVVAGGLHVRLDGSAGPTAASGAAPAVSRGTATAAATTPPVPPPTVAAPAGALAPAAPPPVTSWSWDAQDGVDRAAADPAALYARGRFHVYTTSTTHCVTGTCQEYRVPRFASPDLATAGRLQGDAMPVLPSWVAPDDRAIWAPAVARLGDRYVLYFAATSGRPGDAGTKCLGAAVSPAPEGPFAPLADPLHCTPGYWSIDPYPIDGGDGWYLLWRQDDGANVTGRIVSAPLEHDGLALAGSPPTTLLVGEFRWEEGYPDGTPGIGPIENPAMARHPATGDWLLTWSANRWETQEYATGLAICTGPGGPCRRISGASPWLGTSADPGFATTAQLGGAGGLSFVLGPRDQLYAVLHAYRGSGQAPEAPRVAWAYRVESVRGPGRGYRLADIRWNRSTDAAVNGT